MIKRFLQQWLGVEELSHKQTLLERRVRKQRESKLKMIPDPDPGDMWPEIEVKPEIVKGYDGRETK